MRTFVLKILILFCPAFMCFCQKDEAVSDNSFSFYSNRVAYKDSTITVVIFNIRYGFDADKDPENKKHKGARPENVARIVQAIRSVSPSVVLLQEVSRYRCNTEIKDIIRPIADSLQMNFAFGGHGKSDACFPYKGISGNATLSKFPIRDIETILVYHNGPYKRRSVLRTELQINDSLIINVYNIHHPGEFDSEVKNTGKFIARSQHLAIAGGDFNRRYGDKDLNAMGLHDCFAEQQPGIDRIFCSDRFHAIKFGHVAASENISDHYAYFAKFRVK